MNITQSGLMPHRRLQEIAPEMPTADQGFSGLATSYVSGALGDGAVEVLQRIQRECMHPGEHTEWRFGHFWYKPAGLTLLVEKLHEYGLPAEASALQQLLGALVPVTRAVRPKFQPQRICV